MLAEGRRAAQDAGLANISWVQALAEDLPGAAPGPLRLVTFGQSFHWTDELRVAETVYDMLVAGGAMAMVVNTVEGRERPPSPGHPPIPHEELQALVVKYLGPESAWARASLQSATTSSRTSWSGLASASHDLCSLLACRTCCATRTASSPGTCPCRRRRRIFSADQLDSFVADAQALLEGASADGLFWDWPGDTEIVIAEKPRRTSA